MTGAPYLLSEDRPDYERVLDEALRAAHRRPELAAIGQQLSLEQLRTMALSAATAVAAPADAEYQHYVRVREELRSMSVGSVSIPATSAVPRFETRPAATDHHAPAGLGHRFGAAVLGAGQSRGHQLGDGVAPQRWAGMSYGRRLLAALLGLRVRPEASRARRTPLMLNPTAGARTRSARRTAPAPGWTRVSNSGLGVLVPFFAATVALIFFLVGLVFEMFSTEPAYAHTMSTVVAVGILAVCMLRIASRRRMRGQSTRGPADDHGLSEELALARRAWQEALLERGIVPFLREALQPVGDLNPADQQRSTSSTPSSRPERPRYTRPDFSAPPVRDDGPAPAPPYFTDPTFTGPGFGDPEQQPE